MPPAPQEEYWSWYGDLQTDQGKDHGDWKPRSLDTNNDMSRLKNFVLNDKKVIVLGDGYVPPLSLLNINQIMREGDKAWEGMAPRKIQMAHIFQYTMGGEKAAELFHFGNVDHAETSREPIEGYDVLNMPQPNPDDLIKHAEVITREKNFKNADVLGKSTPTAIPLGFDNTEPS